MTWQSLKDSKKKKSYRFVLFGDKNVTFCPRSNQILAAIINPLPVYSPGTKEGQEEAGRRRRRLLQRVLHVWAEPDSGVQRGEVYYSDSDAPSPRTRGKSTISTSWCQWPILEWGWATLRSIFRAVALFRVPRILPWQFDKRKNVIRRSSGISDTICSVPGSPLLWPSSSCHSIISRRPEEQMQREETNERSLALEELVELLCSVYSHSCTFQC